MAMEQNGIYTQSYITKIRIARAFDELCAQTPYEKVSTAMIAGAAGVSRSSFYYHFDGKNDVVQWLSNHFYEEGLDQIGRTLTWLEGHMVTTSHFDQFANLFDAAASDTSYDAGRPYFIRHRIQTLSETVTEWKHAELTKKLRFQIEALAYAEVKMNRNYGAWYKELPLREFCDLMASIAPRELYELLDEPVHPRPPGSLHLLL